MSPPIEPTAPSADAEGSTPASHEPLEHHDPHQAGHAVVLAALGVVFGDIGTSPLYALRECVDAHHGVEPTAANVLGLVSLIFWSLTMVVTVKYLTFIMRADNRGEGGILALLALVPRDKAAPPARVGLVAALVVFGAALLYGDGMITPAISVLSAMEGLEVATKALSPVVVPLTCGILAGLFWVQKRGTADIGKVFGPVMLVWFFTIGALGAWRIFEHPAILAGVSPVHAVRFFAEHKLHGMLVLGAVVLSITGGEALYADMGHFGPRPIRIAWYACVWPALLLNYFGQGALLVTDPSTRENPFFAMVPTIAIYPMVALATAATIIASQALISGAFSLTRQAIQLGYFPRVTIVHTSGHAEGQIFVPEINWALAVACVTLVLGFQASSALSAAYGIAVTGTMAITSVVYFVVTQKTWRWPLWRSVSVVSVFLVFDLAFLGANALKFTSGGWLPVAVAVVLFVVMVTWKQGRALLGRSMAERMLPLDAFLSSVAIEQPHRVPGTAVFMTSNPNGTPIVLLHHVKHNQVLHERVVLLSVASESVPEVPASARVQAAELGEGFYQVTAHFGFMQTPNVPRALELALTELGLAYEPMRISYYLGRETLLPHGKSDMPGWRKSLFAFVSRNARSATEYFAIPPDRVVELGMQIDI